MATHVNRHVETLCWQLCFFHLISASRWRQARTWQGVSLWLMWPCFQILLMLFVSGEWLSWECYLMVGWDQTALLFFSHIITSLNLFFRLSAGRYPKLAKYYSLLKDRPSIKASRPPHWLASSRGYDILKDLWNTQTLPRLLFNKNMW